MRGTIAAVAVACALNGAALAEIIAVQTVEKEIVARDANGVETVTRAKAEKVTPGETVAYTLHFENTASAVAEDVVLVMPVPEEIAYEEGSTTGPDALVTFSADGGETYVTRGRLTIVENGANRPARGDEITHIKWALISPIAESGKGEVSFKGMLR